MRTRMSVASATSVVCAWISAIALALSSIGPVGAAPAAEPVGFATSYDLYFGDLHSHTEFSDGYGTPEEAFLSARENGADYFAITDHHYWHVMTPELYALEQQIADSFTTPEFVAIAGFEYFIPGLGEINVFNSPDYELGVFNDGYTHTRPTALPSMYDALAARPGTVGMWVHPTWAYSKQFEDYAYWTEERDRAMGVFEIHNYGSWVMYGLLSDEPDFLMALDAGWHVLPAAVSDTHAADWICGYDVRTVLLAEKLTREDLYAALTAQRGYGTLDKNLRVYYEMNGSIMGSTLPSIPSALVARIRIEDPDGTPEDEITRVEIVTDGGVVAKSIPTSGTFVDLTVELSSETERYFYVRVTTRSNLTGGEGLTAWTAPVWTGR